MLLVVVSMPECYGLQRWRRTSHQATSSCCTTHRYEREYGKGQRSVLKKILEQDERPSRAMILCVAEVLRPEASAAQQGALSLTVCPFLMRAAASGAPCP